MGTDIQVPPRKLAANFNKTVTIKQVTAGEMAMTTSHKRRILKIKGSYLDLLVIIIVPVVTQSL
jgi:hypothetical protein